MGAGAGGPLDGRRPAQDAPPPEPTQKRLLAAGEDRRAAVAIGWRSRGPDGVGVFWIDRKTHVLRRFEYPTDELKKLLAGGRVEDLSLVADFTAAQIDAKRRSQGVPVRDSARNRNGRVPDAAEAALLGKPSPDFFFVGLDGKPVTMKSLAGKIAVFDFWATWCQPCRESLPEMEKVYQKFKDNDKVAFFAVNIEPETVPRADLEKVFGELSVNLPMVPRSAAALREWRSA